MSARVVVRVALAVAAVLGIAAGASAQVFGTFTWQMQPYCNQVTLTLTSVSGNFRIEGFDDQCGAAKRASASGMAVFNPDGTVGLNFTIVSPTSSPVHVAASVSPANGQGTWTDDGSNSGTFAFFGSATGLPTRPTADVQFRVVGISTMAMASGAFSTINTWSSAPAENTGGGTFTPGTGTYTVPSAGVYALTAVVRWPAFASGTGYFCAYIFTGTTRRVMDCREPSTTASFQIQNLSTVVTLTAGTTVTVQAYNGSGAATSVGPSGSETMLTVTKLR